MQLVIDQYAGRSELVDGNAVGFALRVELAAQTVGRFRLLRLPHRKQGRRPGGAALAVLFPDRQVKRRSRRGLLGIDLVFLVHRLEQVGEPADRFRGAQEQEPAGLERVMERGQRLLLEGRLQIDEQVAATDQVHAREGRIGDEVLPREDDHLAQRLADTVAAFFLDEEPPQPLRRDVIGEALGV